MPESFTEKLGESVGILSRCLPVLRMVSGIAGITLLIAALNYAAALRASALPQDDYNLSHAICAAAFAISSSICFLATSRR